jgi:hypothetical protein
MSEPTAFAESRGPGFQLVVLVLTALAVLLLVSFASRWYAGQVSLSRYCEQPELALQRLAAVLIEKKPAGEGPRRDYVVAAKLEFLVPPESDEPPDAYLRRVRRLLERQCR